MKIEIEFPLYKRLTLLLRDETDTYSAVIRRLLEQKESESAENTGNALLGPLASGNENALAAFANFASSQPNALSAFQGGAWFDNTHFPEGTKFRATYKGKTYFAEIMNGSWVGGDGVKRSSPSAAASSISNTNVNGWRFWSVKRPQDDEWQLMDAVRS